MFTSLSAIQNAIRPSCQLPVLTPRRALITSLASGIILGLAGCVVGVLASLPALIAVSAVILGVSLFASGLFLCRYVCPPKIVSRRPSTELPAEPTPELPEIKRPKPIAPPPPDFIPPRPLRRTIGEMLFGWNCIGSIRQMPFFLANDKTPLSFRNPSARFRAWNIPSTHTIFVSTSGQFSSLRMQSNLPAAIANATQSAAFAKRGQGGLGVNDAFPAVLTDKCWEESKPDSGILLPGECSSATWEDKNHLVPCWDEETKTYNKPLLFIQMLAPKASMYQDDSKSCYEITLRAYTACFEEAIRCGCRMIQIPLIAAFGDFVPRALSKQPKWIESAKLSLLHAVEKTAKKHASKDLVIVLTNIPQPVNL